MPKCVYFVFLWPMYSPAMEVIFEFTERGRFQLLCTTASAERSQAATWCCDVQKWRRVLKPYLRIYFIWVLFFWDLFRTNWKLYPAGLLQDGFDSWSLSAVVTIGLLFPVVKQRLLLCAWLSLDLFWTKTIFGWWWDWGLLRYSSDLVLTTCMFKVNPQMRLRMIVRLMLMGAVLIFGL